MTLTVNSTDFLLFFAVFCAAYLFVGGSLVLRNLLMVIASYVFYSWWDPRFTVLLLFTSVLDFTVGRFIAAAATPHRRRFWLITSLSVNLAVLAVFKYFNCFRESFDNLLSSLG